MTTRERGAAASRQTRAVAIAPRRPSTRPPSRRGRPRRPLPGGALAVGVLLLVVLLVVIQRGRTPSAAAVAPPVTPVASPAAAATVAATAAPTPVVTGAAATALANITALTAPMQGTYGVYVIDLPTGTSYGQHAQQQFIAASVIKTYILAVLYEQVAKGKVSLDETMTTTAADIQDFGTGSIRYDPVGSTYTLAELARRAAKQSDNTAAFLLNKRLGVAAVQAQVQAWGMTETSIAEDKTSPADIALLFSQLAKRQLLPAAQADALLGLLTDTDFEDRLPALLPPYAIVAHKIGTEANGVMNDAGLVVLPTRSYVVAVLTDGADPDQAIKAEQQISKLVYTAEVALP